MAGTASCTGVSQGQFREKAWSPGPAAKPECSSLVHGLGQQPAWPSIPPRTCCPTPRALGKGEPHGRGPAGLVHASQAAGGSLTIFACQGCRPSLAQSQAVAVLTWPGGAGQAPVRTPEEPHAAAAVLQLGQPWQGVCALWREDQRIRLLWDREGTHSCPLQLAGVAVAEPAWGTMVWGQRLARPSQHSSAPGRGGTRDAV